MAITKCQFENSEGGNGFLAFGGEVWRIIRPLKDRSILAVQTNKGMLYYSGEGIQDKWFKAIPSLNHPDAEFLPQCRWA